jgi:8-oxo-dGTP pyrophosphatase MutT (NUDIX family)
MHGRRVQQRELYTSSYGSSHSFDLKSPYGVRQRNKQFHLSYNSNDNSIDTTTTTTSQQQLQPVPTVIPRAAVSVVVRVRCRLHQQHVSTHETFYLLIQRGTEPNKGMWSFPGGKIEYGESTLVAAQRELQEETQWSGRHHGISNTEVVTVSKETPANENDKDTTVHDNMLSKLHWYNETVATTDSIGEGYHYLIAHCFAEFPTISISKSLSPVDQIDTTTTPFHTDEDSMTETVLDNNNNNNITRQYLPKVHGSDDAADAQWLTLLQIQDMESFHIVTPGIVRVIQRIEDLEEHGQKF